MTMRLKPQVLSLVVVFCSAYASLAFGDPVAPGSLVNASFETGTLAGWSASIPNGLPVLGSMPVPLGQIFLSTEWQGLSNFTAPDGATLPGSEDPIDGTYMAAVSTGDSTHRTQPQFNVTLSQSISLGVGEVISGWSSLFSNDSTGQDSVWVEILDAAGVCIATPWEGRSPGEYIAHVINPWTFWSWTAPTSGEYTLVLGATSSGDDAFATYGFHDEITVPEPGLLTLLSVGIAAVFGGLRESNNV